MLLMQSCPSCRAFKAIKSDISIIKADMNAMNIRLIAVESHMTGFMSTSRYLDAQVDSVKDRLEALEEPRT